MIINWPGHYTIACLSLAHIGFGMMGSLAGRVVTFASTSDIDSA